MVVERSRGGGDVSDEPRGRLERAGPEGGLDAVEQHPPVREIGALAELGCRDALSHPGQHILGSMGLLVDTTPLRVSPDFRRLWTGQAVSHVGSMMTMAALPYQVYHQTGSSLAVGLLGIVELVPLLIFSLVGGSLADSIDKRRLLLAVTALGLCCPAGLLANAALGQPQTWPLSVLAALSSACFAVTFPVLRSLLPMLVGPDLRPAAYALQSAYASFGMMAGPAIAGVLIGAFGLTATYGVDVGSYVIAFLVFAGLAPSPPVAGSDAAGKRTSIFQGVRFLWGSTVMSVFAMDFIALG